MKRPHVGSLHIPSDPVQRRTGLAGIGMAALAVVAFIAAGTNLAGVPAVLGGLFFVSGFIELADEAAARRSRRSERIGFSGAFPIFVSVFLFFALGMEARGITLAIGLYFLLNGAFHLIFAAIDHYPRRMVDVAFGAASVVLGIVVVAMPSRMSPALLTLLVGVEILLRGVASVLRDLAIERQWNRGQATL